MKNFIFRITGWIGTFLIISAYAFNSFEILDSQSLIYQLLNLFGAFLLGVDLFFKKALPALVLQIFWGGIALIAMFNMLLEFLR